MPGSSDFFHTGTYFVLQVSGARGEYKIARRYDSAPPAARTRSKRAASEIASAVEVRAGKRTSRQRTIIRRLSRRIDAIEAEVEEALAVLDHDTGKLIKYTSLLRHPKFKEIWGKAAADEFGRLAQGVGGRIKNPTDTIKFIRKSDVSNDRLSDVTYGKFECKVRPENGAIIDLQPSRWRCPASCQDDLRRRGLFSPSLALPFLPVLVCWLFGWPTLPGGRM